MSPPVAAHLLYIFYSTEREDEILQIGRGIQLYKKFNIEGIARPATVRGEPARFGLRERGNATHSLCTVPCACSAGPPVSFAVLSNGN